MVQSTKSAREPNIFETKSLASKVFSSKSSRQDRALRTLTTKAIFDTENTPLNVGTIQQKVGEVLKTEPVSNMEAMSSFIKTLEDEYEREKKIAEQRKLINTIFDAQAAERRAKKNAEL